MFTYLKLAFRNLWRNKARTLISAGAIFFAVIFALLMRSVQYGVYDNMVENVVGKFAGYIKVNQAGFWEEKILDNSLEIDEHLTSKILAHPNVKTLIPRLETFALAASDELTKGVIVLGTQVEQEKDLLDLNTLLKEGTLFSKNENSVLIAKGLAEYLKLNVGDTLIMLSQGFGGSSASGKYLIKGLLQLSAPDLNNTLVIMPLVAAQYMYDAESRLTSMVPILHNVRTLESTKNDLEKIAGNNYEVLGWKEMFPELIQLIELDNQVGIVMISILYLIIAMGIFGTIIMMTNERIYEFGVLISIGMKRNTLIFIMIIEALMIAFLGVIAGLIMGIPILTYFFYNPIPLTTDMGEFIEKYNIEPVLNFSLNPEIFIYQGIAVFFIAIVLSVYPIWKISKLNLTQALRG